MGQPMQLHQSIPHESIPNNDGKNFKAFTLNSMHHLSPANGGNMFNLAAEENGMEDNRLGTMTS